MTKRADELRERLGLDPDDRLELRVAVPPPETRVAEGYAPPAAGTTGPLAGVAPGLADLVASEPPAPPCADLAAEQLGFTARRYRPDGRIWTLEDLPEAVRAVGCVEQLEPGVWLLDARAAGADLVVTAEDREFVVTGAHGTLEVYALARAPGRDAWSERLADLEVAAAADVEVPPPEEWLAGIEPAGWLVARARELHASCTLQERVASVGLVARLGAGTSRRAGDTFSALLAGTPGPATRARDWAVSLGGEVLEELVRLCLEDAGALADDVRALAAVVATDPAAAGAVARSLCHRRDELQCVAWVLDAAGRTAEVATDLRAVDREADAHLSAFDLAGDYGDDLLSSVAWQEPEAWWRAPTTG